MSKIKVVKFGGSSLADAAQFQKVARIILAEPERRYVVPSAPGKRFKEDRKVTDMLYACYDAVQGGADFDASFAPVRERFDSIVRDLNLSVDLEDSYAQIRVMFSKPDERDFAASRGEYLNGLLLAAYLGFPFVDAAGIIFFDKFGKLDEARTYASLKEMAARFPKAVIPGFYGTIRDADGRKHIKTFSRGGSDITGSIVARGVSADLYENWTDVSGFFVADPRLVTNPRVIDTISFNELRELSYMGATVLHEDSVFPVRAVGIPINIRNTNEPDAPGTRIVRAEDAPIHSGRVTGVAGKRGFCVITMEKDMMNSEVGFTRRVLSVLERHGISYEHLPTGIDTLGIVLHEDILKGREELLLQEIQEAGQPDHIEVVHNIALIAVVGRGMVRSKGIAARLLSAIAGADINIRMIDQGSSEMNIIIGVDQNDFERAVRAVYVEFFVY
ncbi:MAG: aspartate kinase [Clostridiales bacterium]|nr:aspartate kinase [Clostridiales bacterium]